MPPGCRLEISVRAGVIVGDSDQPHAPLLFPARQGRQMRFGIDQVVHLHQVDRFDPQPGHRIAHLRLPCSAAAGPDLGGHEQALAQAGFGHQVAQYRFRAPVHRRGIDHRTTAGGEHAQSLACRAVFRAARRHIEYLPGTQTDRRDALAWRTERPGNQAGRRRVGGRQRHQRQRRDSAIEAAPTRRINRPWPHARPTPCAPPARRRAGPARRRKSRRAGKSPSFRAW